MNRNEILELWAKEDGKVFLEVSIACCPEGLVYIWDEREV